MSETLDLENMTRAQKVDLLEQKRQLLQECNANIEQLRAQIKATKARRVIQRQMEAAAKSPYNNQGLPWEVLVPIFKHYIAQSSMGVRRLYTVCKGWTERISSTPELWSNIRVDIPSNAAEINACEKYCSECVARSGEALLDVYIDYTPTALPFERVLYDHLLGPLQSVNDDPEYHKMLEKWLWKRCRTGGAAFFDKYLEHFMKPIKALTGDSGAVMGRWRKFELRGEQRQGGLFDLDHIGQLLSYPSPNLQSLRILNNGKFPTVWERDEKKPDEKSPFPQLPALRHLSLTYCHLPLDTVTFDPASMQTLEMTWYNEAPSFSRILQCHNLTSLYLVASHQLTKQSLMGHVGLAPNEHEFAYLRTLRLGGRVPSIFWEACSFPVLEHITFVDQNGTSGFDGAVQFTLPKLKTVEFFGPLANKEKTSYDKVLKTILLSCPSLHTVTALEKYANIEVMQSLKALRQHGVTSSSLTALVLKRKRESDEPPRTIDLQPIVGCA